MAGETMETWIAMLPSAATLAGVIIVLFLVHKFLDTRRGGAEGHRFRNQLIMLGLTAVGVLVFLMVLPISEELRGQLLGLMGIIISAAIALSSTTVLGNALAGVMLRAVRGFRMGDFIRTEDHFGRVSERGLFHTEIQTADRELTTLPNLYLVTHPVTTVRSSGTIVSATVSLGYDVPRTRVETLLLDAAGQVGLTDPFVQILELGDFSVNYRIAGLLVEVKHLLSVRSRLRAAMLDTLHRGGVEIVSPGFMNTRALAEDRMFIPPPAAPMAAVETRPRAAPEEVVFDKAEEAESLEKLALRLEGLGKALEEAERRSKEAKNESERDHLDKEMVQLRSRRERLERLIAARKEKAGESDD
jgi:small-conductance mechanosensitive channel